MNCHEKDDGDLDPSLKVVLTCEDILAQEDEIIDTFLNITLPFLHSNALPSKDKALVDEEGSLTLNPLGRMLSLITVKIMLIQSSLIGLFHLLRG